MFRKIKEFFSIQLSKHPGRVVLTAILLLNVVFLIVSAAVIDALALNGTEEMSFWHAAFYTVTMILDAGCISFVIEDIGTAGVALVIICLIIIMVGMVLFTGAVIGYLTNYISGFIDKANVGTHKLVLSGHVVVLNWNTRASEIVNDLLYCDARQKVVILVSAGKEVIEKELQERLSDTVVQENSEVKRAAAKLPAIQRPLYKFRHRFTNKLTVLVREGDTFSTKQLNDISIKHAKTIIILGNDVNNTVCKYEHSSKSAERERGNPQSLKALMQVSDITGSASSDDNQKIVVEVEDEWTYGLVRKIIENKRVESKCNIIPVGVNKILGTLLAQFSLMPELNLAYRELFSNKGATFYCKPYNGKDEAKFTREYFENHICSLPLALMEQNGKTCAFYSANSEKDDLKLCESYKTDFKVKVNHNYRFEQKNVIILGHNSKIKDIMEGFNNFRGEWNYKDGREIMNVLVIDDKKHLEKMNFYADYSYVKEAVEADVYDKDIICETIERFVDGNSGDTSVLILSDDAVLNEQIDAGAITYLIYVRDIINKKKAADPDFDEYKIDVVVEILNPKHYDIIKSYSVNNVVISNRYISKMLTQLGEKDELFGFYDDILTYDSAEAEEQESKEIYIKAAGRFFEEIPEPCTAAELIRAVYSASTASELPENLKNHTIVLGYVSKDGKMTLFLGNQTKTEVALKETDKLIVFSSH